MWQALRALLVPLLVLAVVSGCVSSGAEPTAADTSPPPTFAAKPTVGVETGSLQALVVSEESVPIVNANVSIPELGIFVRSDPDGRLTINQLPPGTYDVVADHLGYLGAKKRADIRAGEVTNLIFTLRDIPIDESYHLTIPRTFYIQVDHDYVHFVVIAANANFTPLYMVRCNPCWYVIHFERNTSQVLSEAKWNSGPGPINTQAYNDFYKGWNEANGYGSRACFVALINGGGHNWTDTCVKSIRTETKLKVFINGGFTTVSVDQRIHTWHTFSYKGLLPDGFTALPPG